MGALVIRPVIIKKMDTYQRSGISVALRNKGEHPSRHSIYPLASLLNARHFNAGDFARNEHLVLYMKIPQINGTRVSLAFNVFTITL